MGLVLFALTVHWVMEYKKGVQWGVTELGIAFNWHPILMTLSLILLYGNGEVRDVERRITYCPRRQVR